MKRWVIVCVQDLSTPAPIAIAEALAAAGIYADVSVARTHPPVAPAHSLSRPFNLAFEVRPPEPVPAGYVVKDVRG